jgi:hypothetical protein
MNGYWPNEPVAGQRSVLVVPPVAEARTWSADVLQTLAGDRRVVVSQGDARGEFDLIIAAGLDDLVGLRGKRLLMPGGAGTAPAHVLSRGVLVGEGEDVPPALALAHESDHAVLRKSYPEAVATVVGDLSYDRLLTSIPFRAEYRLAAGSSRERKLVAVTLTGRSESMLDAQVDVLNRLLVNLPPAEFRVAAIASPEIWRYYGGPLARAWFADAVRAGLLFRQTDEEWRSTLVAADLVIGDLGAVTRYSAAIGLAVMIIESPEGESPAGGAAELVWRHARRLHTDRVLPSQVVAAMTDNRGWQDEVAARVTSRAGYAGELLRQTVYELLDLEEPAVPVPCTPVPVPPSSDAKTA